MAAENVPHEVIPSDNLPAAQYRDLPAAPSWKSLVGPSVLLLGLSLGSGEFVLWPYITYKFGFVVFWACMVGVTTQYFLNMEIERLVPGHRRDRSDRFLSLVETLGLDLLVVQCDSLGVARLGIGCGDSAHLGVRRRREGPRALLDYQPDRRRAGP